METFFEKQTLLVIAPHSDDEAFGCAGTIAKVKNLGGKVYVILVSIGSLIQYGGESEVFVDSKTRLKEFQECMSVLRVDDYDILYSDDSLHLRIDKLPRRDVIEKIEKTSKVSIDKIRPTIVALPATSYNQDHEAVFKAGFTACRPQVPWTKPFQKIVLSYDNPAISWSLEREKFHPNFYVDISDFLNTKLKAVGCHKSQMKPSIHHASIENIEWLARVRGREISVEAAEAFVCHRFVI